MSKQQSDTIKLLKLWKKEVYPSFKAKQIQRFPEWANENFKLTKSTGSSGQFTAFPYQYGLMLLMAMTGLEKLVVFKSAQIGYTQMLLAWFLYETSHRARSTIIYQPTDSDAKDFTTSNIDEVLQICPSIACELAVVTDGGKVDKKDSKNTTHKKVFRDSVGYIKGARSANAFRRLSAPSVGLDEADSMDHDVEGEGRPDKLAASRSSGVSTFIKQIIGSTPTISGSSLIETIASEIDVNLERYYRCIECDHMQPLVFGGKEERFGLKFSADKKLSNELRAKSCKYVCRACSHEHSYGDLPAMDKHGQWRDEENNLYLDETNNCFKLLNSNDLVETPLNAVVYLNGLMSYTFDWWRTVYAFLNAVDQMRNGDISALVTWNNHNMGKVYVDKAIKNVKSETLLDRCTQYIDASSLPKWVEQITIGADVQGDRIEYGIYGWGYGEECVCFEYHKVIGNPATTNVLEQLRNDANRTFYTVDRRQLKVGLVAVDSGHISQTVYDFCSHEPQKYIPIKGANQYDAPDVKWPQSLSEGTYRVMLGTQALKDVIASRLTFTDHGAGYQHWPINTEMFNEEYFHQFTAEEKKIKRVNNQPVRAWSCPNGRRNEPWDVAVYALAAIRILQRFYRVTFSVPHINNRDGAERSDQEDRLPVQHVTKTQNQNPNDISLDDVFSRMAG